MVKFIVQYSLKKNKKVCKEAEKYNLQWKEKSIKTDSEMIDDSSIR